MKTRTSLILLGVSIALNLFLIGAGAGVMMVQARMGHMGPVGGGRPGGGLLRGALALDQPDRRAFRQAMRQTARQVEPLLTQARNDRGAALDRFDEEPFDRAAVTAAFARARAEDGQARQQLEEAMIAFAAGLKPETRKAFAEGLRSGGPGPDRPMPPPPEGPPGPGR